MDIASFEDSIQVSHYGGHQSVSRFSLQHIQRWCNDEALDCNSFRANPAREIASRFIEMKTECDLSDREFVALIEDYLAEQLLPRIAEFGDLTDIDFTIQKGVLEYCKTHHPRKKIEQWSDPDRRQKSVMKALSQLSPRDRSLLEEYYLKNTPRHVLCQQMQIDPAIFAGYLDIALGRFREHLTLEGDCQ